MNELDLDAQVFLDIEDIPDKGIILMPLLASKIESVMRNKAGVEFVFNEGERAFLIKWDDKKMDVVIEVYTFNGRIQLNRFTTARTQVREAIDEFYEVEGYLPGVKDLTVAEIITRRPCLTNCGADIRGELDRYVASLKRTEEERSCEVGDCSNPVLGTTLRCTEHTGFSLNDTDP